MAKVITDQPWKFDAAGQAEGKAAWDNAQIDNTNLEYDIPIYISQIKVDTGDGGNVLLTTGVTDGLVILKLDDTPADDTLWVPMEKYFDGILIQTLPTNAAVFVYHGVD